jgi:GNAT superfamily N-acetyltransferase
MPNPFPGDEVADYRGLVDFNRGLEEPGLLALEDEIRAHVRDNSLAAQAERAGQEAGRQGRAFRDNIGPWAKSLPGRVGNFVVDEGKRLGGTIGGIIDNEIDPMSDEAIQAVFETTGLLALQAPMAGPRGALGVFGGRMAKTADRDALARAERMAEAGADRRAIWDETGWFKGPDGKWRFEIDDKLAHTKGAGPIVDIAAKRGDALDDVIWHGEAFGAYPDMRGIGVQDMGPGSGGVYSRGLLEGENIGFGRAVTGKSVPLHEMQHAIQHREGFAEGANATSNYRFTSQGMSGRLRFLNNEADHLRQELVAGNPSPGVRSHIDRRLAELDDEIATLQSREGLTPRQAYERSAGEVEARNVQTRRDFTPEQRRAQAPWETQDVPDDLQIVRMGGDGPQMSVGRFDFSDARPQSARVGKASLDYTVKPDGRTVTLDTLSTPERARGQGEAKRALDEFLSEADQNGMTVELTVQPTEGGMPKERLRRLYERAGFVDVPGWREVGIDKMRRAPPTNPLLD